MVPLCSKVQIPHN